MLHRCSIKGVALLVLCTGIAFPFRASASSAQDVSAPPGAHRLFFPNTGRGGGVACVAQYPVALNGYANQTSSNSTTEIISIVQQSGGNLVPYFPYLPSPSSNAALLDQFVPTGIRLIANLESATESMFNPVAEAQLVAWVNAVKNHPAFWGYFLYDEPEIRQNFAPVTAAKVQRIHTLIKQNDPAHPTLLNFSSLSAAYIPYLGIANIASFDYYPVHGSGSYRTSMSEYQQVVDKFVADHAQHDPTGKTAVFGTYVQAFRNDALAIREITQSEMQEMLDYARSKSAKFNFASYFLSRWSGQEASYPGLQQLPSLRAKAAGVNAGARGLPSLYPVYANSPCVAAPGW